LQCLSLTSLVNGFKHRSKLFFMNRSEINWAYLDESEFILIMRNENFGEKFRLVLPEQISQKSLIVVKTISGSTYLIFKNKDDLTITYLKIANEGTITKGVGELRRAIVLGAPMRINVGVGGFGLTTSNISEIKATQLERPSVADLLELNEGKFDKNTEVRDFELAFEVIVNAIKAQRSKIFDREMLDDLGLKIASFSFKTDLEYYFAEISREVFELKLFVNGLVEERKVVFIYKEKVRDELRRIVDIFVE